jgi:hypothetical protein
VRCGPPPGAAGAWGVVANAFLDETRDRFDGTEVSVRNAEKSRRRFPEGAFHASAGLAGCPSYSMRVFTPLQGGDLAGVVARFEAADSDHLFHDTRAPLSAQV